MSVGGLLPQRVFPLNEYLASQGYVVLAVNYRGGIGYGLEFREALEYGPRGASEFKDALGVGLYLPASGRSPRPHRPVRRLIQCTASCCTRVGSGPTSPQRHSLTGPCAAANSFAEHQPAGRSVRVWRLTDPGLSRDTAPPPRWPLRAAWSPRSAGSADAPARPGSRSRPRRD